MMNKTEVLLYFSAPEPLLKYGIVHCYCVMVLGTLGNSLALWCIHQCKKTRKGVKVILAAVFFPLLFICLSTNPVFAEFLRSLVIGQPLERVPLSVLRSFILIYSTFTFTELMCIAAVAILRSIAVWSPRRQSIEICSAVGIVVAILVYTLAMNLSLHALFLFDVLTDTVYIRVKKTANLISLLMPVTATLVSYATMMVAIQRNKNRLASVQNTSQTRKVFDPATKSMLAVFGINLLFGMPHAIFHLFDRPSFASYIIIHIIFYTHYVLDPVAFIWFNRNYRQQVGNLLRNGFSWVAGLCPQPFVMKYPNASSAPTLMTPVTPPSSSV